MKATNQKSDKSNETKMFHPKTDIFSCNKLAQKATSELSPGVLAITIAMYHHDGKKYFKKLSMEFCYTS